MCVMLADAPARRAVLTCALWLAAGTRALARVHLERRQAGRERRSDDPLFVPQYMRGTPEEKRRAEARLQRKHRAVREDATDGERQHREWLSPREELREAEARLRRENEERQVLQRRENEERQVLQREKTRREGAEEVSGGGGTGVREQRMDDARVKRWSRERDDAIEKMTQAAERKAEARVQDFFTRKVWCQRIVHAAHQQTLSSASLLLESALSGQIPHPPNHVFCSFFLLSRLLRDQQHMTRAQADALQRLYRKEQLELEYQAQYLRMASRGGTASASPSRSRNHQHDDSGRRAADWHMEEKRRMQRAIARAEEVSHAAEAGGEEQGFEGSKGSEEARQVSIPRDAQRRPSFRARHLPNAARHHWAASTEREVQRVDAARAQPHE